MEEKKKEAGTTERFPLKKNFINGEIITVLGLRAFIANPSYKIPKKTKSKRYYKGQIWKKQKNVTKKSKMSKSSKR